MRLHYTHTGLSTCDATVSQPQHTVDRLVHMIKLCTDATTVNCMLLTASFHLTRSDDYVGKYDV
jgi:hypothetical protein